MIKKSVISLISYDAAYLPNSIKSYYDYVDEIILGLDEDRVTWSGNKFSFDESALYKALKELDYDKKITIIEDNFHSSKVALENDNHERNFLRSHCSHDWIFSIDADEELVNSKDFFLRYVPLAERYHKKIDLAFTWFLPYKEFEDCYLMIANNDGSWSRGDTQGFTTHKDNQFTYCRWTTNKRVVLSPLCILHWSFCRTEANLTQKLKNFGHSDRTHNDPFFNVWKQINLSNYTQLTNFKTSGFGTNQWEKLIVVPKKDLMRLATEESKRVMI